MSISLSNPSPKIFFKIKRTLARILAAKGFDCVFAVNSDPSSTNGLFKDNPKAAGSEVVEQYNWLAHGMIQQNLENGFLIGLEKVYPENRQSYTDLQNTIVGRYSKETAGHPKEHAKRNETLDAYFGDGKPVVMTHLMEYENSKEREIYNAYRDKNDEFIKTKDALDRSLETALLKMRGSFYDRLKARVEDGNFSHIVFISMGWNNDQGVSINRIQNLMEHTKEAAQPAALIFNPLVVGITWPSVWLGDTENSFLEKLGHLSSYKNKADDADEIGAFWVNYLINRLIPRANSANLPLVVVGHSFGGRIVGRAVFSREILTKGAIGKGPDLLALLQPAFGIRRFVPRKGQEGSPFLPIKGTKTIVIATTSKQDTANPVAAWASNVGGVLGWDWARRWPSGRRAVRTIEKETSVEETLKATKAATPDKPTLVDATNFVHDHNDIYGKKMGAFLAGLIKEYAS